MKKIVVLICFLFSFVYMNNSEITVQSYDENSEVYVFYGEGCPHCESFENYIVNKHEGLNVKYIEVWNNKKNYKIFEEILDYFGISKGASGVPVIIIGDKYQLGFSFGAESEKDFEQLLKENITKKNSETLINLISKAETTLPSKVRENNQKSNLLLISMQFISTSALFLVITCVFYYYKRRFIPKNRDELSL